VLYSCIAVRCVRKKRFLFYYIIKTEKQDRMDSILEMFGQTEVQTQIKSVVAPIGTMIYNELYIYIWFICIYNVFLFLIVVLNFYLLLRYFSESKKSFPLGT
jgi:hypothetical protein